MDSPAPFVAVAVLLLFFILYLLFRRRPQMPYSLSKSILTSSELDFYRFLCRNLSADVIICPKIGMKDFIKTDSQHREYMSYFNKIAKKHVDFLLCDPETLAPLLALELDDRSHDRPDRQERDAFVDAVYRTVGLPILHIKTQKAYPISIISEIDAIVSTE